MNKERFLNTGLLEQYVLGLTSEEENLTVEKHLDAFPELREQITSMHDALENYARQYAVPTPGDLKVKIMEELEGIDNVGLSSSTPANPPSIAWSNFLPYAAMILLTIGYLYQSSRFQRSQREVRSQQAALIACEGEKKTMQQAEQIYAFISDTHTQPVILKGTAVSPDAMALVYWNEEEQNAYFYPSQLPKPPADKQYQIWADVEGKMISIGLLDYQTDNLQQISYIADAESLNITLEPKGGSEHPTVAELYVNAPMG